MSQPNNPSPVTGTIQELRQAKTLVEQVAAALKSQKEILKQRGLNLPPMVLTELSSVQSSLNQLETVLVEEQVELSQLRALGSMSAEITTTLDVDTVIREAMEIVIVLTHAERGYIALIDPVSGDVDFRVSHDDSLGRGASANEEPQISRTILNEVFTTRKALLADNAYKDERLQGNESIVGYTLRSVLCVPLMYKDALLGAVYVDNRLQAGLFTEREKNTLTAFANTAAVALANARLYEQIQDMLSEITRVKDLMDNVFNSMGSGILATNADNLITTFNPAAENILEVPMRSTIGAPLDSVLPRINLDLSELLQNVLQKSELQVLESEMTRKDGERIAVRLKLSPLRDSFEKTSGVALVLDDITAERQREQRLHTLKTYLPEEMVDKIHEISQIDLGGERRVVTCMFAEVRPLSSYKGVKPTEMMDNLNHFLAVGSECIHASQGIIDKYMGTEIMGMWNTQLRPTEDHAAFALECALLMRDRFTTLYKELGIDPNPHYYRIGIHSGVATLGNVGSLTRRDFTAIGDTINLSKRLEENATAGQIIISEDTRNHLEKNSNGAAEQYRFAELPAIQVKGRQQQTRVYEVFKQDD